MSLRDRPYLLFLCIAAGVFAATDIGFGIVARVSVGRSDVWPAAIETLFSAATQPVGTAMLFAPFALLAWVSASLARTQTLEQGLQLFAGGAIVLAVMYFNGYMEYEQAMQVRKWTAAALSVGLLPFKSIPVLLVALVVRLLLGKKRDDKEEK